MKPTSTELKEVRSLYSNDIVQKEIDFNIKCLNIQREEIL